MKVLGRDFFTGGAAETAPKLLGKYLCRRMPDGSVLRLRITEAEAYCGVGDTAAHAHKGRTKRTEILWHEGGKAYVYRCYMFWLLNVTVGPEGCPECVLIRGVEGADGPGRASKKMDFQKELYGLDLVPENGIWLEDGGDVPVSVRKGPRVGIPYASEGDREAELNFRCEGFRKARSNVSTLFRPSRRSPCRRGASRASSRSRGRHTPPGRG